MVHPSHHPKCTQQHLWITTPSHLLLPSICLHFDPLGCLPLLLRRVLHHWIWKERSWRKVLLCACRGLKSRRLYLLQSLLWNSHLKTTCLSECVWVYKWVWFHVLFFWRITATTKKIRENQLPFSIVQELQSNFRKQSPRRFITWFHSWTTIYVVQMFFFPFCRSSRME